jgi:hypothetical protein
VNLLLKLLHIGITALKEGSFRMFQERIQQMLEGKPRLRGDRRMHRSPDRCMRTRDCRAASQAHGVWAAKKPLPVVIDQLIVFTMP